MRGQAGNLNTFTSPPSFMFMININILQPNCEKFASEGTCSGENVKLEKIMRSYLNETATIEETGYKFIDVNDPQPAQARADILSIYQIKSPQESKMLLLMACKELKEYQTLCQG